MEFDKIISRTDLKAGERFKLFSKGDLKILDRIQKAYINLMQTDFVTIKAAIRRQEIYEAFAKKSQTEPDSNWELLRTQVILGDCKIVIDYFGMDYICNRTVPQHCIAQIIQNQIEWTLNNPGRDYDTYEFFIKNLATLAKNEVEAYAFGLRKETIIGARQIYYTKKLKEDFDQIRKEFGNPMSEHLQSIIDLAGFAIVDNVTPTLWTTINSDWLKSATAVTASTEAEYLKYVDFAIKIYQNTNKLNAPRSNYLADADNVIGAAKKFLDDLKSMPEFISSGTADSEKLKYLGLQIPGASINSKGEFERKLIVDDPDKVSRSMGAFREHLVRMRTAEMPTKESEAIISKLIGPNISKHAFVTHKSLFWLKFKEHVLDIVSRISRKPINIPDTILDFVRDFYAADSESTSSGVVRRRKNMRQIYGHNALL